MSNLRANFIQSKGQIILHYCTHQISIATPAHFTGQYTKHRLMLLFSFLSSGSSLVHNEVANPYLHSNTHP